MLVSLSIALFTRPPQAAPQHYNQDSIALHELPQICFRNLPYFRDAPTANPTDRGMRRLPTRPIKGSAVRQPDQRCRTCEMARAAPGTFASVSGPKFLRGTHDEGDAIQASGCVVV